jgi:hypothetical protein
VGQGAPVQPASHGETGDSAAGATIELVVGSIDHRTGATWLRRGYEIEERVPRFHFLVKPVENSQLRILTTLSLLNNQ